MTTPDQAKDEKAKIWAEMDSADTLGVSAAAAAPTEPAVAEAASTSEKPAAEQAAVVADEGNAPDPYEGLSQTVRDEIAGLKTMFAQTQVALRDTRGHIGGLNSQLKELREAAKAAKATGGDAPTAEQLRSAQGSAGAMEKLKTDYPEFGEAMDAALNERLQPMQEQIAKAKPATAAAPGASGFVTKEDLNALQVETAHKGWQATVTAPEFRGWLDNQSREVKLLAASDSPQDAIRLLDLHTAARKAGPNEIQTQRLNAAAAIPTGRASSSARIKPIDQMTKAEYWAYLDEQDRIKAKEAASVT